LQIAAGKQKSRKRSKKGETKKRVETADAKWQIAWPTLFRTSVRFSLMLHNNGLKSGTPAI